MADFTRAVFLSYASQDTEAARRICECLRAAGIEVWFDQNELRGGDVWDQNIRQQIHDCAMFVPIISANTESRTEGYFRLEWKLAVDRSHLMADDAAFLLPVVIDDTPDQTARVPDKFRSVQWTRLPGGVAPAAFSQRVSALLRGSAKPILMPGREPARPAYPIKERATLVAVIALATLAAGVMAWWAMHRAPAPATGGPKATVAAAQIAPAHSIAVLPFANMSADRDQEYFSDGLAEELLNLLSKVPSLQVAARTSAFSFKGHTADIPTIGRQLVVANVLEGSVRKVGNHLRITAQLVRADNGYEIWSEIYDRELGDVFRIQDEIATNVVKALQLKLLGNEVPRSTSAQNPDAYLVLLQGRARMTTQRLADYKSAAADFEQAIRLDPNYGPAYVELAAARVQYADFNVTVNQKAALDSAVAEANQLLGRALALDPRNAQAYVVRANLRSYHDLAGAERDYRKAIELDPNSARAYEGLATAVYENPRRRDEVPALLDKARVLDPLDPKYDVLKAKYLVYARSQTRESEALLRTVVASHPQYAPAVELLAGVCANTGHLADAVMYGEQALKLEPLQEWTRRLLVSYYLSVGDAAAASQVAAESPHRLAIEQLRLLAHDGKWHQAAQAFYDSLADGTSQEVDLSVGALALRMDARASGDIRRAQSVFEQLSGVTWTRENIPVFPTQYKLASAAVALGDVLVASGDRGRGERLLRAALTDMNHVARDLRRGDFWYLRDRAIALAALGDRKAALVALRAGLDGDQTEIVWFASDPAFSFVRDDPDYRAIMAIATARGAHERQLLDRLRAEGRVAARTGKPTVPAGAATAAKP